MAVLINLNLNIQVFEGSENNVLDRYYKASKLFNSDYIVRITGDCPLIDPIGVDKVILGSAAIKDPDFLRQACETFEGKIALGLDAKKGKLSVSGWKETTNQTAEDYLKNVNKHGFSRVIYTDIDRDGTKTEPNIEETINIAKISSVPVVVSGGISSIGDIKKIKKLKKFNIEGVIVGKAIYDGDINLNELKELENA